MISFLPMEESSLDRSPNLSKWIGVWASTLGKEVEVLYPMGGLNVDTITMKDR